MPRTSERVKEIIRIGANNAKNSGRSVYTRHDIMDALLQTEEVANVIISMYGNEKYTQFRQGVRDFIKKSIPMASETLSPDAETSIVLKTLIFKAMETSQRFYGGAYAYEAGIPHLFMALCARSADADYDRLLYELGIEKDAVYLMLLSQDLVLKGLPVPSNLNEIRIYDFTLNEDSKPSMMSRPMGTFLSRMAKPEIERKELKLACLSQGYVTDLMSVAATYEKPFIGREDVIQRILQVLCRLEKANPLTVGDPGVGKTAITIGLAKKVLEGKVPKMLQDATFLQLNLVRLGAGASFAGEYESRITDTFEEIRRNVHNPIIYIDELHTVFTGSNSSMHDLGNILKAYLLDPAYRIIASTTHAEYNKYVRTDPAFSRRFMKVDITEPTVDEAKNILYGLKERYEKFHGVTYTPEALDTAVELSARHIHDRFLPDKAIDLIDEAGAWKKVMPEEEHTVTAENIKEELSRVRNIPIETLRNEKEVVRTMDDRLRAQVFGQDKAIDRVVQCVRIAKSGLGDDTKPIGSFLFVGPSGVGKTELARTLANVLGIEFIRFDMSEYSEPHTVAKLFGSPAGYVGYGDGGLLTNEVQKKPHSVLLFDEIEKANEAIYKSLLQILDYGIMTDSRGNKTDFRNCVIIFTSNAGLAFSERRAVGFGAEVTDDTISENIMSEVKRVFPVEFLNRLSAIVQFNRLSEKVSLLIANKEMRKLMEKLEAQGYEMHISDDALRDLAHRGTSTSFGGREVVRVIDSEIRTLLADRIIDGTLPHSFVVTYSDGKYTVQDSNKGVPIRLEVPAALEK